MAQSTGRFRIGTRGSPLALKQAEIVRDLLAKVHGLELAAFEIVPLKTTGDRVLDRPLADAGGKGLFTKEIDEALLTSRVDLGVHSAKDVPTFLPAGISLAAYPAREDPRDVLVSSHAGLAELPKAAVVGTSSVRRQALVLRARPDVSIKLLRGNVGTRLDKVARGEFDAAILAAAGLRRLGLLAQQAHAPLDPASFPPSPGQGAIGIAIRTGDAETAALVAKINDAPTEVTLTAERAFLAALDGSCRAPIGGHARITGGRICFSGIVIAPDGSSAVETTREGYVTDAERLGRDAGQELRARAPAGVLDA
ncbi:MAG TPA: hydroxymethylbilane synthase [Xanthobacteraceae bacterium]|nr:hydroxymethylbilane synthase [Xanthobacteraceae bacterium]